MSVVIHRCPRAVCHPPARQTASQAPAADLRFSFDFQVVIFSGRQDIYTCSASETSRPRTQRAKASETGFCLVVQGDSAAANRMLVQLASFLRLTLYGVDVQEIPLHQEIANTEHYLAIEKARLGERLELEFAVAPEVQDALVPALFLQPLVENAIRHGIAPNPAGGKLTINAQRAKGRVRVIVSNDSLGTHPHQNEPGAQRRGFGLSNTMERFRVLYGTDHRLIVHRPREGGCQVEIDFPYRHGSPVVCAAGGEEACA